MAVRKTSKAKKPATTKKGKATPKPRGQRIELDPIEEIKEVKYEKRGAVKEVEEVKKVEEISSDIPHLEEKDVKIVDPSIYDEKYFEAGIQNKISSYSGYEFEERYNQNAKDLIDEFKPQKVLDVGCAKGFLVKGFKNNNVYAVGCDISEYAISKCPEDIKNYVAVASITNLAGYRSGAFDLVIAYDVLEHLTDKQLELAIEELKRTCSKDGVVSIQTPPKKEDWDNDVTHINIKSLQDWIKLFVKHGLRPFNPSKPCKYWSPFDYRRTLFFKK